MFRDSLFVPPGPMRDIIRRRNATADFVEEFRNGMSVRMLAKKHKKPEAEIEAEIRKHLS